MFEANTEEAIWERILNDVPKDLDIRAGSILYTALSPAVNEIARMYNDLDRFLSYTFASENMPEHLLDLRVGEMGLTRNPATYCIKKAEFKDDDGTLIDIPLGSRYYIDKFYFKVVEKISTGTYQIQAEISGIESNNVIGNLIPVDYIDSLAKAEIVETTIPAEDIESNEELYLRYIDRLNEKPFGGNIADYKIWTKEIEGVGDVKVIPVWNGGGTVKLILIDAEFNSPTKELISKVKNEIDPIENEGKGIGVAPIGHVVTVESVKQKEIYMDIRLVLKANISIGQIQSEIESSIEDYFLELRKNWANEFITIYNLQIMSRLLNVTGVIDCISALINQSKENIILNNDEIPVLKELTLSV